MSHQEAAKRSGQADREAWKACEEAQVLYVKYIEIARIAQDLPVPEEDAPVEPLRSWAQPLTLVIR